MPVPRPVPRLARRTLLAAVTAVALIGAACSDDDDAAAPGTTTTVPAPTTSTIDPAQPTVDGTLRIGVLVPQTGSQAALGPAMKAAATLAVDDVNKGGGVLGKPVEAVFGDAGDASTDTAGASVDTFAGARVDVIVGPPSSAVTSLVLDKIARSTAALISPGNPLPDPPTDVPYLQLAPGLELLGTAVGEAVASNGRRTARIVARDDPFGQRVSAAAAAALQAKGVTATVQLYNPESEAYGPDIDAAVAADPEQVVFIGYAELAEFLSGFIADGVLPGALPMFVVTDRLDDALFRRFTQPGQLTGLQAIGIGATLTAETSGFADRVRAKATDAMVATFATETYDAVAIAAVAAAHAETDAPEEVRDAALEVTGGAGSADGTDCTEVAACLDAAADGADVSYVGHGGPYRLGEDGAPTEAAFGQFPFSTDNLLDEAGAQPFRVTVR